MIKHILVNSQSPSKKGFHDPGTAYSAGIKLSLSICNAAAINYVRLTDF
jgi:hypothetical protein